MIFHLCYSNVTNMLQRTKKECGKYLEAFATLLKLNYIFIADVSDEYVYGYLT